MAARRPPLLLLGGAAVCAGVTAAASRAWLCDDAFISFRYAQNLIHGLGLVYNAGERVEGYTNLLWTLYAAAGMAIGVRPETSSIVGGLLCFAAVLALLVERGLRQGAWFPLAAVVGAAHTHLLDFATSGLETSLFTLLVVGGFLLAVPVHAGPPPARRLSICGVVFGLASMTRPDGAVLALVTGGCLLAARPTRARLAGTIAYAAGFLLVWVPVTGWRTWYYGDFWPNTYYAKSAMLTWWPQGWLYVRLYLERYWILLAGPPLVALGLVRLPPGDERRALARATGFELALFAGYALAVARVGGDFMFGRLLVPVTPLLLMTLERGVGLLGRHRQPWLTPAAALAAVAAVLLTPPSVTASAASLVEGITDERGVYVTLARGWGESADQRGEQLGRAFQGLPVVVCFYGAEARIAYRSQVATAIECDTGLTDAYVARQPLAVRGRVGHEKRASLEYLLRRGTHFVVNASLANDLLQLDDHLPDVPADILGVRLRMLGWDPALVAALRARGARIPDVPAQLDAYLRRMDEFPDERVAREYARMKNFYFDRVDDPARRAQFEARLSKGR